VNRQISLLGAGLLAIYLVLFVQLNRIQLVDADGYRRHPDNSRPLVAEFGAPRGDILAADGTILARSVELEEGPFARQRDYPEGELFAHLVGYFSFDAGADGLEAAWDEELRGDQNQLEDTLRELLGGESTTADLQLTVSVDLQRAARDALGERRGSVVVIDAQSGAIESLWSYPSFDPNPLADTDTAQARSARSALLGDPANPLLPRTTRELFFPGSTFKIVTAAAALDTGTATLDFPVLPRARSYVPPLTTNELTNFAGGECGGPLRELVRRSCNSGMAQLAVELLGPSKLIATAEGFGFNSVPPLEVPGVVASNMPTSFGQRLGRTVEIDPRITQQYAQCSDTADCEDPAPVELLDDMPVFAQAAIGQFEVKATPLQMALVAAAVANDGEVPRPHVVSSVVDSNGSVVHRADLTPWRRAVSLETAVAMREAMREVVVSGTGRSVAIDGLVIGAKTGTAELGASLESTHAWMIAFAGEDLERPQVAVAVIVEADEEVGEQTGGRVAGPVARAVLEAWQALG
jgi:peptidoglycan glycosyltransferase